MAGRIELHQNIDGQYHVKMVDDFNNILAVLVDFETREAALKGVFTLREIAGTAHVSNCIARGRVADRTSAAA